MRRFFIRHQQYPLPFWLWPLLPAAWAYGWLSSLRLAAYRLGLIRPVSVDVPVISVGNLTTGGTGKTPVIIHLARYLTGRGQRVVVLSRGYGASRRMDYGRVTGPECGDEAWLIQQEVPEAAIIVGPNRARNAERAIADHRPDVILLDDGFQHIRLARTLNVLLVDGRLLFGNGHLLPLGPLREPLAAIRRADVVLVTKTVSSAAIEAVERAAKNHAENKAIAVVPAPFSPAGLFAAATGEAVAAARLNRDLTHVVSGIARPRQLLNDLRDFGLRVDETTLLDDHHAYTGTDVRRLLEAAGNQPVHFITTSKDWVKLAPLLSAEDQQRFLIFRVQPLLDVAWFLKTYLKDRVREAPETERVGPYE